MGGGRDRGMSPPQASGEAIAGGAAGGANTSDPVTRANRNQRAASDPAASAFVAASAGSGKTKLLIDRLLRLMLAGSDPARLLCLTYTRAAAAEMAMRLNRVLASWVGIEDGALDRELAALGVAANADQRAAARELFARVLDLPGGMRISTIHAFCQSVLRRFPLEAALSPHFRLIEEADAALARQEAREAVLAAALGQKRQEAALTFLAATTDADTFAALVETISADGPRWERFLRLGVEQQGSALRRALGITATSLPDLLTAAAGGIPDETALRAALQTTAAQGSPSVAARATALLAWLEKDIPARTACWAEWHRLFVTAEGLPLALSSLLNKNLLRAAPALAAPIEAAQRHALEIADQRAALALAEATLALLTLAGPMRADYAARKEAGGYLDYHDLISRTLALLDAERVGWVLYKLDGGIDHLLIDEAQDTAPAQWRIARALSAEFFAGAGARGARRTVFAVGDVKQSIYSFQGAAPAELRPARDAWRRAVEAAGATWRDVPLDVSFRAAAPILDLVDAVFADPQAAHGVVEPGERLSHQAARRGAAGRVELWPLLRAPEAPAEAPSWSLPDSNRGQSTARQRLAERLAGWIAATVRGGEVLASRGRAVQAGDVLVLVRRRDAFSAALVRALKAADVRVAGLDRLSLTEPPAVADLLTLCDVLLLPEDELSLAALLTSPLGGLSDDSLMALALERREGLWETLRARAAERAEWQDAADFLQRLRARVDFTTPFALLTEALGRLGGRARLYARLGPEAAEPVDELLAAARSYGETHPPSLQGFVQWVRSSGAEIKREAEAAGNAVRVMTVHGAKGLQAPLVILPDTTGLPPSERAPLLWAEDPAGGEVPLWAPRKDMRSAAFSRLLAARGERQREEHNRLLYVALTRAEDWLVVCGAEGGKAPPETCWYRLVERGMARCDAARDEACLAIDTSGERLARVLSSPQSAPLEAMPAREVVSDVPLPPWAGRAPDWRPAPLPAEPALPTPLAPSRPEGAEDGPVPPAASPLGARERAGAAARQRGQILHALLQHLPDIPPSRQASAAAAFLARSGLTAARAAALAEEALALLRDPELAPLFGPQGRAEVPITGVIGGRVVGGMIDRLAVLPDRVLIADYKTSAAVPRHAAATPVLYLRQMAAYRAVLRAIHGDRPVLCALVWTASCRVDFLPASLLDAAARAWEIPA